MKRVTAPLPRLACDVVATSLSAALLFAAALVGCSGPPGTQPTFAPAQSARSQRALSRGTSHRIRKMSMWNACSIASQAVVMALPRKRA